MNNRTERKNILRRMLAVLMSMMMLIQPAGVFADDSGLPENAPEGIVEKTGTPAAEITDTVPAPAEAPAESVSAPDDPQEAPDGQDEDREVRAETPEAGSDNPAGEAATSGETEAGPAVEPVVDISDSVTMTEAGYVPAPVWFEGTLVHEGPDYTVTAVIGTDAMLPENVEMRVAEILPGTEQYGLYTRMMEETLEEGEELGGFARYFDISFAAETDGAETEIKPQASINVQITFGEPIAKTEESDVQAVHFADNTAEILETMTDSLEAAANDEEAIDTVTFSAGSFSVYGVVQKIRKSLKVITASGESFTVDVTFTSDAGIPDDAELIATEITPDDPAYETYREQTALALGADDVRLPGLFDLGIYVNGEKIQPAAPVNVTVSLSEGIREGEKLYVVHFPEGIEAAKEPVEEAPRLMAAPKMMRKAPLAQPSGELQAAEQPEMKGAEPETTKTGIPAVVTEVSEATVEGETATFEVNGFSVYALAYTVDFHFGDYEYSIPGGGALSLRKLLEITGIVKDEAEQDTASEYVGIPAEETTESDEHIASGTVGMYDEAMDEFIANVEQVEFSNPELVWIGKIEEDKTVGQIREEIGLNSAYSSELSKADIVEINETVIKAVDWVIISLKAFTTSESLRITMADGTVHVIEVTDGQIRTYFIADGGNTYRITVTYDDTAGIPADAKLQVRQLTPEDERYQEDIERTNAALLARYNQETTSPLVFEIRIIANGEEIEPAEGAPVKVEISLAMDMLTVEPQNVDGEAESAEEAGSEKAAAAEEKGFILIDGVEYPASTEVIDPRATKVVHLTNDGEAVIIENLNSTVDAGNNVVVTFETESFSDYTIQPGNGGNVDLNSLPSTIYVGDEIYMQNLADYWVKGIGYTVTETKYNGRDDYKSVRAIAAGEVRICHRNNWNNGQPSYNDKVITILPARDDPNQHYDGTTPPGTIETVSNASIGLTLNLFDYDLDDYLDNRFNNKDYGDAALGAFINHGINNGHSLKFWGSGITDSSYGAQNNYVEHGVTSIVRGSLSGGYPVLNSDGTSLEYLFAPADGTDKKAYLNADGLFKKDGDYYVYNSNQNYAWYNPSTNKFTVYDGTYNQKLRGDGGEQATVISNKTIGFFPFHKWDSKHDLFVNWDKNLNHHFGMSMNVKFSLPKDPKAVVDTEGNPIVFEFSGDDDLWVFIDGRLAMDIGGIHQPTSGTINFKDQTVTANGQSQNFDFSGLYDGEPHTLQVFYIERGGCDSNCMIKFNLTQYGDVAFDKVDKDNPSNRLQGAVFGIYKDEACTEPLMENLKDGTSRGYIAVSDANGHVAFSDISLGNYWMKELKAPAGYPLDDTIHTVNVFLDENSQVIVKVTIDGTAVSAESRITNTSPSPISLTLRKEWQNVNGDPISAPANTSATFELKRIRTYEQRHTDTLIEGEGKDTAHLVLGWIHKNGTPHVYEEFDLMVGTSPEISWEYADGYTGRQGYILNNQAVYENTTSASHTMSTANGTMIIHILDDSESGNAIKNLTITETQFYGNSGGGLIHAFTRVAEPDPGFTYTGDNVTNNQVTLPIDETTWEYVFTNLPVMENINGIAYNYTYYLVEVESESPDGTTAVYKDGAGNVISSPTYAETNKTSTQTVANQVDLGALELIKKVTLNGKDVADSRINATVKFLIEGIDGTYTEGYSQTAEITYARGVVTGYRIGNGESVSVNNGTNIQDVLMTDLVPGDYRITETEGGTTKLKSVEGGKDDGSIKNKTITVTVTQGKNVSEDLEDTAKATFTNVGPIDIPVIKKWNGSVGTSPVVVKLIRYKKDPSAMPELTNGALKLIHTITGYNGALEGFTYTAENDEGKTYSLHSGSTNSLPAGIYTLHVNADAVVTPANYQYKGTTINPEQVTISVGETSTVVVTSTYETDTGILQLVHTKEGYDNDLPGGFVYTAKRKDGTGNPYLLTTGTNTLPVGEYALNVNADAVIFPTNYSVSTTISPEQVTISVGGTSTAIVTSTFEETQGRLILTHQTTGDYTGDVPNGFAYTAVRKDGTGDPISLIRGENLLPVGEYTLNVNSENAESVTGYDLGNTTVTPEQVTISAGDLQYAIVTSTYNEKPLTIYTLRFESSTKYQYEDYSVSYRYKEGTAVSFWFDNGNSHYSPYESINVIINGNNVGTIGNSGRQFSVTMNSDITIVLYETGNSNWNEVVTNSLHVSPSSNANSLSTKDFIKGRLISARITATNGMAVLGGNRSEGNPYDLPEGYEDYVPDQEFEQTKTLSTGNHWQDIFRDLDVIDEYGYEYVYEIQEITQIPGYDTAYGPDRKIIVALNENDPNELPDYTVTITNTERTGDLIIEKKVTGRTDTVNTFSFTVQLTPPNGVQLKGSYPVEFTPSDGHDQTTVSVNNNRITISGLKADEQVKITGLPEGTSYSITENVPLPLGYSEGTHVNASGVIPLNQFAKATMNNIYQTGSLEVTKALISTSENDPIPDGEYTYNVIISTTHNNTTYYVQNEEGALGKTAPSPSLTVSNLTSLSISNLPYGEYTVTEENASGVAIPNFSYVIEPGSSVEGGTVTVEDNFASFELKNYYTRGASWTPEATKLLNGTAYNGNEYSFILTETTSGRSHTETVQADNGKAVFSSIEYHNNEIGGHGGTFTYTISEVVPDGVTTENPISGNIQYDTRTVYVKVEVNKVHGKLQATAAYYRDPNYQTEVGSATFDNTELGTLTVSKTVSGSYTPTDEEVYPFTVKKGGEFVTTAINGTTYTYTGLSDTDPGYTVKAGETLTFINMPVGEYTVTEGDAEKTGYVHTTIYRVNDEETETVTATIAKGETAEVEITNHYRDAELVIKKTIDGVNDEDIETIADSITITLKDAADNVILDGVKLTDSPFAGTDNGHTATLKSTDPEDYAQYIVPDGTYTVIETITPVHGYELKSSTYQVTAKDSIAAGTEAINGTGYMQLTEDVTSSGEIVFTNTYIETVDIDATKTWKDLDGNSVNETLLNASITYKLQQSTDGENWTDVATRAEEPNPRTLSNEDTALAEWKISWTSLPKYEDDTQIQYRVVETAASVFDDALVSDAMENKPKAEVVFTDDSGSADIENTLPDINLHVTKQWKDGTTANADRIFHEARSIGFTLYQKLGSNEATVYTGYGENGHDTINYMPGTGDQAGAWGTVEIESLPVYVYDSENNEWLKASYYVEEDTINGVTVTYKLGSDEPVTGGAEALATNGDNEITIKNTDTLVDLNILKVDADGMTKPLAGAEFTIRRFDETSAEMTAIGEAVTATTGNDGIAKFEGLKAGYYIVTETKLPAGYIPNGNGSFCIRADGGEVTLVEQGDSGWTESSGNAKLTFQAASGENPAIVTVGNDAGSELPNTGGTGTKLYTILGLMLVITAGTILLRRKRKA